jgi:ketosteroid isomerase-like protein
MSSAMADTSNQTYGHVDQESFVNRLFGCIDSCDWQALADLLHDEAIYERPGYAPFVGKPAIMDFYLTKRIISRGRHVVEKVLSDGADIACWGSFSGCGKDGSNLGARFADVYHIRDGRIDLRRTFFDSPAV